MWNWNLNDFCPQKLKQVIVEIETTNECQSSDAYLKFNCVLNFLEKQIFLKCRWYTKSTKVGLFLQKTAESIWPVTRSLEMSQRCLIQSKSIKLQHFYMHPKKWNIFEGHCTWKWIPEPAQGEKRWAKFFSWNCQSFFSKSNYSTHVYSVKKYRDE